MPIGFCFHRLVPRALLSYYSSAACRNAAPSARNKQRNGTQITNSRHYELSIILYVAPCAFRAMSGNGCAYASRKIAARFVRGWKNRGGFRRKVIACEQAGIMRRAEIQPAMKSAISCTVTSTVSNVERKNIGLLHFPRRTFVSSSLSIDRALITVNGLPRALNTRRLNNVPHRFFSQCYKPR